MKKIIIILFLIFQSFAFTQENLLKEISSNKKIKNDIIFNYKISSPVLKDSNSNYPKFSIGVGVIYSEHSKSYYSAFIPLNLLINLKFINNHIHFLMGIDITPRFEENDPSFYWNFIPSYSINMFKKKITLHLGAGVVTTPLPLGGNFVFLCRFEYKFDNDISTGIDYKHPISRNKDDYFIVFKSESVNILNLFCSYKLEF